MGSCYNEHLIRDRVPAERIVAYAKVEKELLVEKLITAEELEQVQIFVSHKLGFATQFDDPKDNVLVHKESGKYQIRVSFNKAKVTDREGEVSAFFDQFKSMGELVEAAQKFASEQEVEEIQGAVSKHETITVVGLCTATLVRKVPPSVHPNGKPISHSTRSGFNLSLASLGISGSAPHCLNLFLFLYSFIPVASIRGRLVGNSYQSLCFVSLLYSFQRPERLPSMLCSANILWFKSQTSGNTGISAQYLAVSQNAMVSIPTFLSG